MSTTKTLGILAVAVAACGVKVNGTSYNLGGSSGNPASAAPASAAPASASPAVGHSHASGDPPRYAPAPATCRAATTYRHQPPYLETPVDPWIAIDGDRPIVFDGGKEGRRPDADCSALHDHCVRECAWFVPDRRSLEAIERAPMHVPRRYYAGDDEMGSEQAAMFRTVPATARNLKPGSIVVATPYPSRKPATEEAPWTMGRLDRVDLAAGKMYMKGSTQPFWLSATRVAVIAYRKGGPVAILDGRKRDELAVRVDELFLPLAETTGVSEPWSQVGSDGQPLEVAAGPDLEWTPADCSAARDHCLRPWAWFVDTSTEVTVARHEKGGFVDASGTRIGSAGAAYRTIPATRATLRSGARVLVQLPRHPTTESQAHRDDWFFVKVNTVRPDGTFTIAGERQTPAIEHARIPVLFWMPGEKAEAL